MMVPSTMVCVGIGSIPKLTSAKPRFPTLSWTTLMELLPISRPMHVLAIFAPPHLPGGASCPPPALLVLSENRNSIARLESERFEDLPLRVHPAAQPTLDPIDRERGNSGSPRQLRLRHHLFQAE